MARMRKVMVIAVVVVLMVIGGGAAGAAYQSVQNDRLPDGFEVGGWSLAGLPASEGLERLRSKIAALELAQVRPIHSVDPANSADPAMQARTLKQLGMRVTADEAVRALQSYRNRGWWERAKQRVQGGTGSSYPISVIWDDTALEREIGSAWGSADMGEDPVNATREINDRDEVVYTPETAGRQVDIPALSADVKMLAPVSLAGENPAEAKTVALPVTEKAPEITVASLQEEGIERKIAEFTTSFTTSAAGRSHNVAVTSKALDETMLQPDEIFEYGKIVDKAERESGYREAPVIVKGKLTPGVGGGICQVSSTLYNAILHVGLDVVERRNHSLVVHYLPPGLDATFADGYVNFRFRNSTGKNLLIRTVVRDKHLTVKLFGTMPENVAYKTETKQLKVIPPQTRYVGNSKIALGQQRRLQKGADGYVVDTYRIKLVDGHEVSRDKMPRSTYKAQEELIAVNPGDPRLKPLDKSPVPSGQDAPVEPV